LRNYTDAKLQAATSKIVVWEIASLTHGSLCPAYVFSPNPQAHLLDTQPRAIRHYTSLWTGSCFPGM